ncbi:diacylglycerol/lipid kinase family protein [Deinococcus lacus]|uniref:Diacylglycerol/lipid kinase family protein n=1 Tax=Deinococcus lacus TaxID=392561 RepID=A0ABW1Y9M5_9DEIO
MLNPAAGHGRASREWPQVEALLRASGTSFSLIRESTRERALARLRALPPGPVVAVGGDGTAGALLPALAAGQRPLALVPLGTGNDFAGWLGLHGLGCLPDLLAGRAQARRLDLLRVQWQGPQGSGERLLMNGLGMGFDAQLTAALPRAPGWLPGQARYLWAALGTLAQMRLHQGAVRVDGQVLSSGPTCLCAVMNGTRYGGGFLISPESDPADGRLNVVVGQSLSRARLPAMMLKVAQGRHLAAAQVVHATGQTAAVTWQEPAWLHLDGDVVGEVTSLQAEVLPGALTLLGPARSG